MIASLRGTIQSKTNSAVILDVCGVGYLVQVPGRLSASFSIGDEASLLTTLVVRDDNFQVFGFETLEQQGLFDQLRGVSGVGPKTALSIISTLTTAEISRAVTDDDSKAFEIVSGVGSKTAKLINLSLAGKLKFSAGSGSTTNADLLSALQSLGWSEKIAGPIVESVCAENRNASLAELIRACLAKLGK